MNNGIYRKHLKDGGDPKLKTAFRPAGSGRYPVPRSGGLRSKDLCQNLYIRIFPNAGSALKAIRQSPEIMSHLVCVKHITNDLKDKEHQSINPLPLIKLVNFVGTKDTNTKMGFPICAKITSTNIENNGCETRK
jgi:hypothetical protein